MQITKEGTLIVDSKDTNLTIDPPAGFGVQVKNGHVSFYKKEETPLQPIDKIPTSWEGLNNITGVFITSDSRLYDVREAATVSHNKNIIPIDLGNAMLAYIQLLQLRDRTWVNTNSKPTGTDYFSIVYDKSSNNFYVVTSIYLYRPLSFSSMEIANKFMQLHLSLLLEAQPVL